VPTAGSASLARRIFDRFPYGLLALERSGAVIHSNARARELLGADLSAPGVRCCDLVGCRDPAGALAGACVTELAVDPDEPLPEVRVDLPTGRSTRSAWLAATTLDHEGVPLVLLALRPASQGDRRRRTEPHWREGARLRISVLGRTRVESSETSLNGAWLEQRAGELLKFLVAERGRTIHAEEIAEAIWPQSHSRVLGNVRHYVHALRERLEPGRMKRGESLFVLGHHGGYQLNLDRIDLDVDEFERQVERGVAQLRDGAVLAAAGSLTEAMELYEGDFLADMPFAEWAFAERERLRAVASRALWALAEIRIESDELDQAAEQLQQLAEMFPIDPYVHRELIALCLRRGRNSEALRRYSALRVRLRRHLGEEPDFELADLSASPAPGEPATAAGRSATSG
jgi:DNA-binding SARP family transcriptional activator